MLSYVKYASGLLVVSYDIRCHVFDEQERDMHPSSEHFGNDGVQGGCED
jgi:hypothetical protein